MIYRVTRRTTSSFQPGTGTTFWSKSVLYCGRDIEKARIHYHSEDPYRTPRVPGNPCRDVVFEIMDEEDLADDDIGEFSTADPE